MKFIVYQVSVYSLFLHQQRLRYTPGSLTYAQHAYKQVIPTTEYPVHAVQSCSESEL